MLFSQRSHHVLVPDIHPKYYGSSLRVRVSLPWLVCAIETYPIRLACPIQLELELEPVVSGVPPRFSVHLTRSIKEWLSSYPNITYERQHEDAAVPISISYRCRKELTGTVVPNRDGRLYVVVH